MRISRPTVVVFTAFLTLLTLSGCDRLVRVSTSASGGDANGESGTIRGGSRVGVAVDGTGRVVVFESAATNLLPGGNASGLFLRDLSTGSIQRLSSGRSPDITADGRYLVYTDQSSGSNEVYVLDRTAGPAQMVSVRPDGSPSGAINLNPSISDDGRYVAWESQSGDLVPGTVGTNVFVRDRQTLTTRVVSVAADGGAANETSHTPAISGDGRFVAFSSWASNLTVGDTPTGYREVFRRDLLDGVTQKVSVDDAGTPISFAALNPTISDDGSIVAFDGPGPVYVRDLVARRTENLGTGLRPAVSGSGRIVVFLTAAAINPWDTNGRLDVYARDRVLGITTQVSVTGNGQVRSGDGSEAALFAPAISDDGHMAAFPTESALLDNDHNGLRDVYLRSAWRPTVSSVSPATLAPGTTATLVVSGDGFTPLSGVEIDGPGSPGVHVTGVQVDSAQQLRVDVVVDAAAPAGRRTLAVTNRTAEPGNPVGTAGFCQGCVTVS